jgi:hypothetical protein
MEYDDVIVRDENGHLAVNTVSGTEADVPYNYDDCFTLDTNNRRALRVVGAGGGSVDYTKVIVKSDTMPTASASYLGYEYQYFGATDANYTHGYIYECVKNTSYTDSVTYEAATLSGTVVTSTTGALAMLASQYITGDIESIVSGTLTYDSAGELWVFVGKDSEDNTVGTFQVYQQDYEDAGFTFTGTPEDGDVVAFTCTITDNSTYAWQRLNVQPTPSGLPSQTGNSGKFLTTDGTDASWSDKPLVNNSTNTNALAIGNNTASGSHTTTVGAYAWNSMATYGTSVGYNSSVSGQGSVAIGANAHASGAHSIQISSAGVSQAYNNDANTVKVANDNGNFEIMSADGTIPAARHAALPASDGTYVLKLVISGGVATLSWVAE